MMCLSWEAKVTSLQTPIRQAKALSQPCDSHGPVVCSVQPAEIQNHQQTGPQSDHGSIRS